MNSNIPGLQRGERAPDFVLPLETGTPTHFYAKAGGSPTVLVFSANDDFGELQRFSGALAQDDPNRASVVAVKANNPEKKSGENDPEGISFPVFVDDQGRVRSGYRLQDVAQTVVFVLDNNLRVLESFLMDDVTAGAQKVFSILQESLPRIEPIEFSMHAPVLIIPNVLTPVTCEHLINIWQNQGGVETGVEQSAEGRRRETISPDYKKRRDHVVMDKELLHALTVTVGRRIMPEVRKAFSFKASRFEGFKIVCYEAEDRGFFHAHRDNLSPSTAHRRFAMTLNLNDDYEGGVLRFPEYGPHTYRPDKGSALVFSCSHLHEVTDVTKGRRFALLSFLFAEEDVRASRSGKDRD